MERIEGKSGNSPKKTVHVRCSPAHYSGCLLGGAIADALGAAVEGKTPGDIREVFGVSGVEDYAEIFGRRGAVTAHTQLTLFTAEGLLRARVKAEETQTNLSAVPPVYHAYQRWLATQDGIYDPALFNGFGGGWLIGRRELYQERFADKVCLEALAGGELGRPDAPLNDHLGCGAAARMAPPGLLFCSESVFRSLDPATVDERVFDLACRLAALTHGHPDAFLAAGCHALMISRLIRGDELYDAVQKTLATLVRHPRHQPCSDRLEEVLVGSCCAGPQDCASRLSASRILAQAIRCALDARDDFARGVLAAVNLGGPGSGRGTLTGQLLGARFGRDILPPHWLAQLELYDVIDRMAEDLFVGFEPSIEWMEKYPGW